MTDIKQIAAATANRIFDRMELCRGSAMLKSDIEREVEMALRELVLPEGHTLVDTEHDERIGTVTIVETKYDDRIGHPVTVKFVEPPATGILGEARKSLEDYRASRPQNAPMTATEVKLDLAAAAPGLVDFVPSEAETIEIPLTDDLKKFLGMPIEEIAGVGYINDDKEHVLISIRNPTLTSEVPKPTCAQIVITMDNARELEKMLNSFIFKHDAKGCRFRMHLIREDDA